MKRTTLVFMSLLVLGLVILISRPVLALWLSIPVTKNAVIDGQEFTVTTKHVEQFIEFDVTLAPHPRDVSPFLLGQLSLISDDKWVASVPVSEKRDNGKVTYWFRVMPEAVAESTFEISASAFAPAAKETRFPFDTAMIGKQKVEQIMGGIMYNLKLKDFAGAK